MRPNARTASLAATFIAFAASVSIVHGQIAGPLSSRYIYVYCLLATLLIAELARGVRLSGLVQASLCVVALAAVVSNIGNLRWQGAYFRQSGAVTNGALTALDLDRGSVSPNTLARISLYPYVKLSARSYFEAERTIGSPAYTVAQLRYADSAGQSAADSQLLADGDVTLASGPAFVGAASPPARAGAPPAVFASTNGTVGSGGTCIRFTPAAALAPGSAASVSLIVHPGRFSVTAGAAPSTLSIRRFAATPTPLGTVAALHSAIVTVRGDSAPEPWYLELSSIAPVRGCSVGP
jgi:hypothetical protein